MELPTGTVTFLFSDVEGSTRLLHDLGQQYSEALGEHSRIVESQVGDNGGVVVNTEGDAFFCVFSNAVDAISAAVGIQRDLASFAWPEGGEFRVRIGVHTGEGILGGRDYVGIDVHRAARISSAGHGGQVLLSTSTFALVNRKLPATVTLRDLGKHQLKDLPEAEHLYQLWIPGLSTDFPALRTKLARSHNLPASLNTFVGRSDELVTLIERFGVVRLITLVGPGGTGKTRLAVEIGMKSVDGLPDGVWITELASVFDPDGVSNSVAAALRLRERPDIELVDAISEHLADKSMMLILDNCEHLVEAAANLANRLLASCPDLRILSTSRQALGVRGELVHQVPGLTVPNVDVPTEEMMTSEAVQLFFDRAMERKGDFSLTAETAVLVAQICRSLDGIPLAIELAAARVNVLGVEQIADRLDDRFQLLKGGSAADLPHHQTLRLAIDWSYDLLTSDEATLFAWLSVFSGGCTLEAIEAVYASDSAPVADVVDLLQSLIEKSLVAVDSHQGRTRYRLLETIRAYASEKLTESGERASALRSHGLHYVGVAEDAEPVLQGSGDSSAQAAVLDRLEVEHGNFRAAMEEMLPAEPDIAGRLAGALWRYWEIRGYLNEGSEWLTQTLNTEEPLDPAIRAKVLAGAGKLAWRRGAFEEAEPLFRESLDLWRAADDLAGEANALHGLARATLNLGNAEAAQSWGQQSLEIQTELDNRQGIATATNTLGEIARFEGDFRLAHILYSKSLDLYQEVGDTAAFITVKHNLGYTALGAGEIDQAENRFLEAMTTARDLRDHLGIFSMFGGLAAVAIVQGNAERAAVLFGAADAVATDGYAGDRVDQIEVQRSLDATKAALRPDQFNRAFQAGEGMSRESAIAFALGHDHPKATG